MTLACLAGAGPALTAAAVPAPSAVTAATASSTIAAAAGPAAAALPAWRRVDPRGATNRQFRGLAAVSSKVAWLAGTRGTALRTVDGGGSWADVSPRGLPDTLQFRDVEALDARRAVALTIGEGTDSRVYRTVDGGTTWTNFVNPDPKAFYDCIAFSARVRASLSLIRSTGSSASPGRPTVACTGRCRATPGCPPR